MSQVHKSAIAQPIPVRRNQRFADFATVAIALAATGVATFLIVTSLSSTAAGPAATAQGDLVDGWMPAAAAAQTAHLQQVQDGFLPGLVGARAGGDPVDGYLAGLIAARGSADLVDGWMPGFSGATQSQDLTDGWESSLLP